MNEKIKASEVQLTGLLGEDLGVLATREALAMAKQLKVDLVCLSLLSSPPPCQLVRRGEAKHEALKEKSLARKQAGERKVKEIRLTTQIEEHDYETKKRQCETILRSGDAVQLVIRLQGKEAQRAKELLEGLLQDLSAYGRKESGVQLSGKQAAVQVNPI